MNLAPIALFVYKRPIHTLQVLEALRNNSLATASELFVFADGPRSNFTLADQDQLQATRDILKNIKGFKRVQVIVSETNRGLAKSVTTGVSKLIEQYGKVIVMEDDIITGTGFLEYMNHALELYQMNDKVISISGYTLPINTRKLKDTFFLKGADCWGWATWKRGWDMFNDDAQSLLDGIVEKNLQYSFNLRNSYPYIDMLKQQLAGQIDSWAIKWHATAFLNDKLTLYPRHSLVKNIGLDGSGTHSGITTEDITVANTCHLYPIPIIESITAVRQTIAYYRKRGSLRSRYKNQLHNFLNYKKAIKRFTPPALKRLYRTMKYKEAEPLWWQGNFKNWGEAKQQSSGYDDAAILNKTKQAVLQVKNGKAVYERDSVLFDTVAYNWVLVTFLLKIAIENNNQLNIVDFGGSLGSSYFQNKTIIPQNIRIRWTVVDQPLTVDTGNREIKDEQLSFCNSLKLAVDSTGNTVLLLSGVLQYLEEPDELIAEILNYKFNYIIIDRTTFIADAKRLTVQYVPQEIYKASYPCWFFNEQEFTNSFLTDYEQVADFSSFADPDRISEDNKRMYWKGFILKIKA